MALNRPVDDATVAAMEAASKQKDEEEQAKEEQVQKLKEAQTLLMQQHRARIQQCSGEVDEVLKKYGCRIVPSFTMTPQGSQFSISIEPNPQAG